MIKLKECYTVVFFLVNDEARTLDDHLAIEAELGGDDGAYRRNRYECTHDTIAAATSDEARVLRSLRKWDITGLHSRP